MLVAARNSEYVRGTIGMVAQLGEVPTVAVLDSSFHCKPTKPSILSGSTNWRHTCLWSIKH